MIRRKIFLLLISLFHFTGLQALNVTFTYPNGQSSCGESLLEIRVVNNLSNSIGPVNTEFKLDADMNFDSTWTNIPGTPKIEIGNSLKFFYDFFAPGQGFTIYARLNSNGGCASVNCSQLTQILDSLIVKHSGSAEYYVNQTYLKSPCISYDEAEFVNRLQSATVGDTITRSFILRNTGSGVFHGRVTIVDNYRSNIEIDTIYIESLDLLGNTVSSALTGDSTYTYSAMFQNVHSAETLRVVEKVVVKKCIENDEGKSDIYIDWGCGNSTCQQINPSPINAQVLKDYKKPDIKITPDFLFSSNCIDTITHYRYKVVNKGSSRAVQVQGFIQSNEKNTYSRIVPGSVVLSDTASMFLTSSGYVTSQTNPGHEDYPDFEHGCLPPGFTNGYNFGFTKLLQLDSFYVDFDVQSCCPASDTFNMPLNFDDYTLLMRYNNVCLSDRQDVISLGMGNTELYFNQMYEPRISDMKGQPSESANFEIFNIGMSGNFYKLNSSAARIQIVLKTDTGLAYIDSNALWNGLHINSPYGIPIYPYDIQRVFGGLSEGYQDTMVVASFILPDTFYNDRVFFNRYFRNSSVYFDLQAYCPGSKPFTRFTQEVYLNTDPSCPGNCNSLLSSITENIAVHCPGCITPGWVADRLNVRRITTGERDDDNDRLPDFSVPTAPDLEKIKHNRYSVGDTIGTSLHAFIVDGDPGLAKNIDDLENNGAKSFKFKYCYLKSSISDGKIYELLSVKVVITDADGAVLNNGKDSVNLPLSCVQKFGNINDSLPDADFFFHFDLDTLYKYGFNSNYEYDAYDEMRVDCKFRILDPADNYLSDPPGDEDPWLLIESSPYRIQRIRSLLYLTGQRDVYGNGDVDAGVIADQDPELLDSTMIYWCETYGGVGTWIGRKPELIVGVPLKVFCDASGGISFDVNPAGGVFANPFPYEYRKFVRIDSIQFWIPQGYKLTDTSLTTVVSKPYDGVEYEPCTFKDTIFKVGQVNDLFTVYADSSFTTPNTFNNGACKSQYIRGDEQQFVEFLFRLRADCGSDTVLFKSPIVHYTMLPEGARKEFKNRDEYITPARADLELTPKTISNVLNKPRYCYDITLENKSGAPAPFGFIRVVNASNKLSPYSLSLKDNPSVVYYPDTTGTFYLDTIPGVSLNQYELCLDNRCDAKFIGDAKDSIELHYGYDCEVYPNATMSNICQRDSITHTFTPPGLNIRSGIEGPAQITMCDNFQLKTEITITGVGVVSNFLVNIVKSDMVGIFYKSGTIDYDNGTTIVSKPIPASIFNGHVINLDSSLKVLNPAGYEPGDVLTINLGMYTNCRYDSTSFRYFIQAITSSCDTINGDTLKYTPQFFFEYPVEENLAIVAQGTNITNLGGTTTLTIPISNSGTEATENNHLVELVLPVGYTYNSMSTGATPTSTSDTLITWSLDQVIPAGASNALVVVLNYPTADNCDSVKSNVRLTQRYFTNCDTARCFIAADTFNLGWKSVCTPCPPNLNIGDTCKGVPIFNALNWTRDTASYCVVDTLFYKIYFASDVEQLNFAFLLNTTDSLFRHIDLSSFDGCYYITAVSKKDTIEGPPSEVVCNKTCIEDFICDDLFISNLITLNDDNKNDAFEIRNAYTKVKVEIFNRWGNLLYQSDDYKNDFKGENLAAGVYYYSVTVGDNKYCNGWLHLLKE